MTGCVTFTPIDLPAARPESDPPFAQSARQSLIVHVTDHEHAFRVKILNYRSKQPLGVAFQTLGHIIG